MECLEMIISTLEKDYEPENEDKKPKNGSLPSEARGKSYCSKALV